MRPSTSPGSLSKTFSSTLLFPGPPGDLMQKVAAALKRMRSTVDGHAFWILDDELRFVDGQFVFRSYCPLELRDMTRYPIDAPARAPIQTSLILVSRSNRVTYENALHSGIILEFSLHVPDLEITPGPGEYHILATCASIGEHLLENKLLTREQLPGFWQLMPGAWEVPEILRPEKDDVGLFMRGLLPFGYGQMTEQGILKAVEIRSWVTGCVKWCGLTAAVYYVPVNELAKTLNHLGVEKSQRGDFEGAIKNFTDVIESPYSSTHHVTQALLNRAAAKKQNSENDGAIADYTAVIGLPKASAEQALKARVQRGHLYETYLGDNAKAFADYVVAADGGDPWGQAMVGWWYLNGTGETRNLERAEHYFQLAAAQGNEKAKENLRLYFSSRDAGGAGP